VYFNQTQLIIASLHRSHNQYCL